MKLFQSIGIVVSALSVACASVTTLPLIPHHVQRQRRLEEGGLPLPEEDSNFRRRDTALQVGALYHGYGTHYIDLWCGTPPQRQTVIVDTGSGSTAFPCSTCNDCGAPTYHIDNYFMEGQSSTFSKVPCKQCKSGVCARNECRLVKSYSEGSSWYAYEAIDQCYVGGPHNIALTSDKGVEDIDPEHASAFSVPLDFGCQTKLTGLFKTQLADGIMGMDDAETAFWRQMFDAGKAGTEKKFSLCYARPLETAREGTEAGAMSLGGCDTRLHQSPMVFANQSGAKNGFYSVHVRNIYLREGKGGLSVEPDDPSASVQRLAVDEAVLNYRGTIVDSGTTDTYITSAISGAFQAAYKGYTGKSLNQDKVSLTVDELKALPTILIQLEGNVEKNKKLGDADKVVGLVGSLDPDHPNDIVLAIPPTHYMEPDEKGMYTARFYFDKPTKSVLGANAMMGHDIMFDSDNSVIGFAESDCDYQKVLQDNGYNDVLSDFPDAEGNPVPITPATPSTLDPPVTPPKSSSSNPSLDNMKVELQKEFTKMSDACASWYCKGGLLFALFLLLCCVCCIGRRCCSARRDSLPAKYERAELEMNNSHAANDTKYRDDPVDGEYGEFEVRSGGVSS